MRLSLQRLCNDDDDILLVRLDVEDGARSFAQDFYTYLEDLGQFATRLQSFPSSTSDAAVFEYGSIDSRVYCWLRIRAYVYDGTGHTALEFSAHNNRPPPELASVQFSVKVEAATINRLGLELAQWSRSKAKTYDFETGQP